MIAFHVEWPEDSSVYILGRVTSLDGSGEATGAPGEGYFLEQADIDTIECKVFDLDSDTPQEPTQEPAIDVADVILDTPDTSDVLWNKDSYGHNFRHHLGPLNFPVGGRQIRVEYKFTLNGGAVFHGAFVGVVQPVQGS